MTRGPGWAWPRWAAAAAGVVALGFGAQQLLVGGPVTALTSSLPWLAGVLLVHDAVLAPLAVGAGWALRRAGRGRAPWAVPIVAGGLFVAVLLSLVAGVAALAPGVPDNPTVLPRDAWAGLVILLAVDFAVTGVILLVGGVRRGVRSRRARPQRWVPPG